LHESREAPHAVEKNTRIYVYDRTANKNEPYELADMERIESLLNRRRRLVDQRELELQENRARASRTMHPSICPIRWISISPVYPWRNIHDQYDCKGFHQQNLIGLFSGHWTYQTIPGGSFGIGRWQEKGRGPLCMACSSLSANGTLFAATYTDESFYDNKTLFSLTEPENSEKIWVNMRRFREMTETDS